MTNGASGLNFPDGNSPSISIAGRRIGAGAPVYVIAEMSGNHGQSFDEAVRIIEAAKAAGADAIKLQTYTADTLTIDAPQPWFRVEKTLWTGRQLYDLYSEAHTPWEWQPKLKEIATKLGLHLFSSPFDPTSVEFLETMDVPAYKIASFEIIDLPLIRLVAGKGKPLIMSTGMATLAEIDDAVRTARDGGASEIALLKCNSGYPAPPEEMNLRTIPHLAAAFGVVAGLSDHTLGSTVAVASVALGASIIEKHLTLSRSTPGPDTAFSLEPSEFATMVSSVREVEKALGRVTYDVLPREAASRVFRRSLFVVEDMKAGEKFAPANVRSIRPGNGLPPKEIADVLGRNAAVDIKRGTPLSRDLID